VGLAGFGLVAGKIEQPVVAVGDFPAALYLFHLGVAQVERVAILALHAAGRRVVARQEILHWRIGPSDETLRVQAVLLDDAQRLVGLGLIAGEVQQPHIAGSHLPAPLGLFDRDTAGIESDAVLPDQDRLWGRRVRLGDRLGPNHRISLHIIVAPAALEMSIGVDLQFVSPSLRDNQYRLGMCGAKSRGDRPGPPGHILIDRRGVGRALNGAPVAVLRRAGSPDLDHDIGAPHRDLQLGYAACVAVGILPVAVEIVQRGLCAGNGRDRHNGGEQADYQVFHGLFSLCQGPDTRQGESSAHELSRGNIENFVSAGWIAASHRLLIRR
jgi:hypothetical protein